MAEQQFKLEVPAQIKEVAEKTIDQAERSFHAFIEAANKSVSMLPNPPTDLSLRALSLTAPLIMRKSFFMQTTC